jgi:two-component sensor histidine kinase
MAMSIVHEAIYSSPSMAQIDLCNFVPDLIVSLRRGVGGASGIAVSTDIEPGIVLDADLAVPCGMVLNELITNALKHAFPGEITGRVMVEARRTADGRARVTVRDDGVGLPNGFDWRQTETLGLTIIVGLVENQLDGGIEKNEGPGVAFSFAFKDMHSTADGEYRR